MRRLESVTVRFIGRSFCTPSTLISERMVHDVRPQSLRAGSDSTKEDELAETHYKLRRGGKPDGGRQDSRISGRATCEAFGRGEKGAKGGFGLLAGLSFRKLASRSRIVYLDGYL